MKSITMLYFLLITASSINIAFSYAGHKTSLQDLFRKSMAKNDNTLLLGARTNINTPLLGISSVDESSNPNEASAENVVEQRDTYDSEEEHYFKWASQNRRPMESLAGRKREVTEARNHRINSGLWRTGLVG